MAHRKQPLDLKRNSHTMRDVPLWEAVEQLGLIPRELKDTLPNIWPRQTPMQLYYERLRAKRAWKECERWKAIVVSISPPTEHLPMLVRLRSTRALYRIVADEVQIWRRDVVYRPGRQWAWDWFSPKGPPPHWAQLLASALREQRRGPSPAHPVPTPPVSLEALVHEPMDEVWRDGYVELPPLGEDGFSAWVLVDMGPVSLQPLVARLNGSTWVIHTPASDLEALRAVRYWLPLPPGPQTNLAWRDARRDPPPRRSASDATSAYALADLGSVNTPPIVAFYNHTTGWWCGAGSDQLDVVAWLPLPPRADWTRLSPVRALGLYRDRTLTVGSHLVLCKSCGERCVAAGLVLATDWPPPAGAVCESCASAALARQRPAA